MAFWPQASSFYSERYFSHIFYRILEEYRSQVIKILQLILYAELKQFNFKSSIFSCIFMIVSPCNICCHPELQSKTMNLTHGNILCKSSIFCGKIPLLRQFSQLHKPLHHICNFFKCRLWQKMASSEKLVKWYLGQVSLSITP